MPDISMCPGDNCPFKEKCYRFTAAPDKYSQSYMDFSKHLKKEKNGKYKRCEHFMDIPKPMSRKEYLDALCEAARILTPLAKPETGAINKENQTIIITYEELHKYINAYYRYSRNSFRGIGSYNDNEPELIPQEEVTKTFDEFFGGAPVTVSKKEIEV